MSRATATWILAATLLAPSAALAQDEPARRPQGRAATGSLLLGELTLSLEDAIAMGIENNLNVEIERHQPYIAAEQADGAWGSYDPELFADLTYASNDTPSAFSIANPDATSALKERTIGGQSGLRGLVPKLGATYELNYSGNSLETDRGFQSLVPEYNTSVRLSASFPLMRDFLWSEPWFQVKSTRILSEEAYERFRQVLMDTVFTVQAGAITGTSTGIEAAYWNLVAAAEQLRVAEKSVETAEALLEQTQAQYEVGVVSRVEVVESEAGVAQREFDRITAENAYRRAQDVLIDLVLGPNLQATSRLEIRPSDSPDPIPYDVDADRATGLAFELRPELVIARREIERREIQQKFARNQRLPTLDLVGNYGYAGLSGKGVPVVSGTTVIPAPDISRRYSSADDDFFRDDGAKQWSAGAVLSFPLGNRRAVADANIAGLELRRARTQLRRAEQDVILEVRDAVRNLRTAQDGIEAAEARRRATEEQLRAERIRLENGESTPFDVLDREEDLVEAESQKIGALQVYRNSLAELDRAQGTILRNRNIVVDQARTLR